jgi:hypothetical protein
MNACQVLEEAGFHKAEDGEPDDESYIKTGR